MPLQIRAALVVLALAGLVASARGAAPQGATLEGRVTGPNGRPVQNVRVTLTNDGYSPIANGYTDASGRFRFAVGEGAFYVEVDPIGQPFERYRERVEVRLGPFTKGGEIFRVDIQLIPTRVPGDRPGAGGVRFAQQVPEAAYREYDRAAKLVKDKPDDAIAALRKAIELFPDYYDAMELLGTELVKAGRYDEARPVLVRAVEVNPAGEGSRYAFGVLSYRTGRFSDAVASLREANALNPKSPNTALYLGLAHLRSKQPADAEVYLKRAYEMGAKGVADLHLALASIYIDSKRNREAAAQLRLLLAEVPNLRDRDKIKALIAKLEN
jgi:tetratricopeptide (TPR) repeat protein